MRSTLLFFLCACTSGADVAWLPCPCAEGFVCVDGYCVAEDDVDDGGPNPAMPDAWVGDAGPSYDARPEIPDAFEPDVPTGDAGPGDAEVEDVPRVDAGPDAPWQDTFNVTRDTARPSATTRWSGTTLELNDSPNGTLDVIFDAGRSVSWGELEWEPAGAYGRPFSRNPEPNYEDGRVDISSLNLLLDFDSMSSFIDGARGRRASLRGSGAFGIDGVHGPAIHLTDDSWIDVPMTDDLVPPTGDTSWTFWARSSQSCNSPRVFAGSETPNVGIAGASRSHVWLGCREVGDDPATDCAGSDRQAGTWHSDDLAQRGSGTLCTATQTNDGRWHHFVAVKSGNHLSSSRVVVYVDGVQISSFQFPLIAPFKFDGSHTFQFGHFPSDRYPTTVDIDQAVFFNRALSQGEVLSLYDRGRQDVVFEFRVCQESDCSDGPPFRNLDGEIDGAESRDDGRDESLPIRRTLGSAFVGRYAQLHIRMESIDAGLSPRLSNMIVRIQ